MKRLRRLLLAGICVLAHAAGAAPPDLFQRVGFDQMPGAALPLGTAFRDADGARVTLGQYFHERPVVLVLGYYECPNLCGIQWRGFLESARELALDVGRDYEVVAVSIDPGETAELAARKRQTYIRAYGRPGSAPGWHFLTGEASAIRRLAQAAGFRYVYDPERDQYAHASGLVVATPDGVIARYLFGVRFAPTDLRLALVESSRGRIGSPVDQLLLLCYHYDPANGQYGLLIMNLLRGAGVLTVGALAGFVVLSRRREARRGARREPPP
ncbi:MAG: SCO family protein [Gammaproteobacteria bacterium]|jgi:protein SCO1/2